MREEDRSHGQMKTEGGKVAAFITMPSSVSFQSVKSSHVDASREKEVIWDEFLGRELPPNCKIPRVRGLDSVEKRKQDPYGRRDVMVERSIWDDEFQGHRMPSNYISRVRNPEGLEKKKLGGFEGRRGGEATISGAYSRGSNRHTRYSNPDDTFEYNFDKTVDSYVLSEVSCGKDNEWGCVAKPEALFTSSTAKHECLKVETFEERALRFGVEDWNLFGNRKWTQQPCESNKGGSKRSSTRRGIFHSPSGSDTSSMISTLESSSFSCGSEASSFAKRDLSSSSFNLSYVYAMSGGPNPLSSVGGYPSGFSVERPGDDRFVEFDILESAEKLDCSLPPEGCTELIPNKDGSCTFFEFNFLDGRMVDSENLEGSSTTKLNNDSKERSPQGETAEQRSPEGVVDESATSKSPEDSENLFDSSQDSDWSGTHSVSTLGHQGGHGLTREVETIFFDDDNASTFTEDRLGEDWSGDHQFYDAESFSAPRHSIPLTSTSSFRSSKGEDLYTDDDVKVSAAPSSALVSCPDSGSAPVATSAANFSSGKRSGSRSPRRKTQGASRKTRSLGSVLSHHLAFTSVPSLRHKSQPSLSGEQKESPAKVTAAACIEWLWSEKDAMKPVKALRAVAEREYAERDRIGSSPPVRSLDHPTASSRGESRIFGLGKTQQNVFSSRLDSTSKRVETSPVSSTSSNALKDSRDSILASWAAVYGTPGVESAAAARAVKRPSTPTSKVSLSATSLKHVPKAGVSPRKRSVSFGAQVGSKVASSLTKQQVPKSLAVELEVLCRPFGPVLKGVRLLPTAKRGLGRPPLFPNLGPQVAPSSSSSSMTYSPAVLKCGRLQCVVSRDGLPSYSLIMDETEEIFAAKTLKVDGGLQEGVSHVYTFHSFRGKGKGKTGWRQWGKKEKPGSDFAGNMTVTSTIRPVLTSNGMQNFMESEFVLFDAKVKDISISGPTSTNPYPRSSFSSWDTATPQRSPQQGASPSFSSPSSTYFSLPSPSGAVCTTPASGPAGATVPPRQSSTPGVFSSEKSCPRVKQMSRHMSLTSPLHPNRKSSSNSVGFHESSISDSETADDYESRGTCAALPQSQSELAAVVVRTPMEKSQGKTAPSGDKWGWGINFLRKSLDGSKSGSSPEQGVAGFGNSPSQKDKSPGSNSSESSRSSTDERLQRSSSADDQSRGGLIITLVLPSGEHGCSANGVDGPQPLIERWRSGGKCDCGSWDLGCGLTIVDNQKDSDTVDAPVKGQLRDDALQLFVEGKKQDAVALALTPLKEGCYTLGFQAPISPLHAFATAVAVLHSRDPSMSSKKAGETRKRLTRIPVKVLSSSRSFSRQSDDPSASRSLVSYKLVCPDPPSSPFGRA